MRIECSVDELDFEYEIICCGLTLFIRQRDGTEFRFTNGVLYRLSRSDGLFEDYKEVQGLYCTGISGLGELLTLLCLNLFGTEYDALFLEFLSTKYGISGFDSLSDLCASRIRTA